jgi:hypothetical protein
MNKGEKIMKLKYGDKYQHIVSLRLYTLYGEENGMWRIEDESGKGESCCENDMIDFLQKRFIKYE